MDLKVLCELKMISWPSTTDFSPDTFAHDKYTSPSTFVGHLNNVYSKEMYTNKIPQPLINK